MFKYNAKKKYLSMNNGISLAIPFIKRVCESFKMSVSAFLVLPQRECHIAELRPCRTPHKLSHSAHEFLTNFHFANLCQDAQEVNTRAECRSEYRCQATDRLQPLFFSPVLNVLCSRHLPKESPQVDLMFCYAGKPHDRSLNFHVPETVY